MGRWAADSWPPPPRQKELFQPFSELDNLTLFKRLLEQTPFMKLEESQGAGFDLSSLNKGGGLAAQVDAIYFIHKDNATRRRLEVARKRSGVRSLMATWQRGDGEQETAAAAAAAAAAEKANPNMLRFNPLSFEMGM